MCHPEVFSRNVDVAYKRPAFGSRRKRSATSILVNPVDRVKYGSDGENVETVGDYSYLIV